MDLYDPPSPVIFWCPEKLSFNVNMFQQGFSFPPLIFLFMFCFFCEHVFFPNFFEKNPHLDRRPIFSLDEGQDLFQGAENNGFGP